jgi:fucose 4-O-acetylase-like acetyltransferase
MPGPDLTKAFGIVLVVFGHVLLGLIAAGVMPSSSFWETIIRGIYLFHMPLFFYVAGLFFQSNLERGGTRSYLSKNTVALLGPLVVWSYMQFTLQYLSPHAVNHPLTLFDVLSAPFPPRQQFWFIGVLFASIVLCCGIFKMEKKRGIMMMLLGLYVATSFFIREKNLQDFMDIDPFRALVGQFYIHVPFFLLGILLPPATIKKVKLPAIIPAFSFVAALTVYVAMPPTIFILHIVTSIVCVLSVYKLAENLAESLAGRPSRTKDIAVFIGMNSMIVYLAHVICAAAFRALLLRLGVTGAMFHLFGGTIAGVVTPLALVPVGIALSRRWRLGARIFIPVRTQRIDHG